MSGETVVVKPAGETDPLSFPGILHNKDGAAAMKEFLRQQYCEQMISFWEVVQVFRQLSSEEEIQQRSQEIYDEYVRAGVPTQINIMEPQRLAIIEMLKAPHAQMFNDAEKTMLDLIKGNFWLSFLGSSLYTNYKAKLQQANAAPEKGKGKAESGGCCVVM